MARHVATGIAIPGVPLIEVDESRGVEVVRHINALGYIGIGVRDIDAWDSFASTVLGLQTTRVDEPSGETLYLRMDERRYRIAIRSGADDLQYTGWEVGNEAGLDALCRDLDSAGVSWKADEALARERGVHRLVASQDPAGNVLEFYLGGSIPKANFVSPTGARFVTRSPNGADLGFGHIVLTPTNLTECLDFYLNVLGFAVSDYISPVPHVTLTFMHVNPRHHSLALARPFGTNGQILNHFMLEVDSVDSVGRALDTIVTTGIRKMATLGRHTNDGMLSFYVHSPSGFGVEYGTDGILIDERTWTVKTFEAAAWWGHGADPD